MKRVGMRGPESGVNARLALIDYGAGNLSSVGKGLEAAGAAVVVATTPEQLDQCDGVVIPGVGNFRAASALDSEWREAIMRAIADRTTVLGICLGMQFLFDGSDEAPHVPGLGLFEGRCTRILAQRPLKVPHVGWNELTSVQVTSLLEDVNEGSHVYFSHSYAAPVTGGCAAISVHGEAFAAAVEREHVCGVQFHPEKSGETGLQVLRNFVRMTRALTCSRNG